MIRLLNLYAQRKKLVTRLIVFSLLFSNLSSLYAMNVIRSAFETAHSMIYTQKFPLKKIRARNTYTPAQRAQATRAMYSILGYSNAHDSFNIFPIAEKTESQELHISWLIDQLDRAHTSMGGWGLRELSYPHASTSLIIENQSIIKALMADEKGYKELTSLLDDIYNQESAIFSYFDAHNALSYRAQSMYFTFFLIPDSLKSRLNKSLTALELATWVQFIKSGWSLAAFCGASGIKSEFERMFHPANKNPSFDLMRALKSGFREIITQHNPYPPHNKLQDAILGPDSGFSSDDKNSVIWENFHTAWLSGDWAWRYKATAEGTNYNIPIKFPFLPEYRMKGEWKPLKEVSLMSKVGAGVAATVPTLIYDYGFIKAVSSSYSSLKETHLTMRDLRERCVRIKEFFGAMDSITRLLEKNEEFKRTALGSKIISQLKATGSPHIDTLLSFLDTQTFDGNNTFFYSRGRVLAAHTLLTKVSKELTVYLKAIGQIDAYMSVATLMKEHAGKPATFSFALFENQEKPAFAFEGLWIPVLKSDAVVTNSFVLGNDHNTKAVVTGPNGGGKSTFLKAIGQAVWLAQSWGIVPASYGCLTMMNGLRTCLHAQEDLQRGMSTFMAEKARMDDIQQYLEAHAPAHSKVLALIDEPYRGTVDAESAERIDSFGKKALAWDHCGVILATHVYPPAMMANFEGYHVEITEPQPGTFVRTFELKPGVADWWFNDAGRRARFIDWLSVQRSPAENKGTGQDVSDKEIQAIRQVLAALAKAEA